MLQFCFVSIIGLNAFAFSAVEAMVALNESSGRHRLFVRAFRFMPILLASSRHTVLAPWLVLSMSVVVDFHFFWAWKQRRMFDCWLCLKSNVTQLLKGHAVINFRHFVFGKLESCLFELCWFERCILESIEDVHLHGFAVARWVQCGFVAR